MLKIILVIIKIITKLMNQFAIKANSILIASKLMK